MSSSKTSAEVKAEDVISAAQMRALEQAAMASGQASGAELMERAGAGVAQLVQSLSQCSRHRNALVLCGPGNNGGDGYVVARLLARAGWKIDALGLGALAGMPADAALNRRCWEEIGETLDLSRGLQGQVASDGLDVIVDGVFGTGLVRPITGALAQVLRDTARLAQETGAAVVAVDLPSGLATDSGEVLGTVLPAQHTVTFHSRKPAHLLRPELCGAVSVVDIGL